MLTGGGGGAAAVRSSMINLEDGDLLDDPFAMGVESPLPKNKNQQKSGLKMNLTSVNQEEQKQSPVV